MCVGLRAAFTEDFFDAFVSGPLRGLHLRLIRSFFRRVRVCRVVLEPDPEELGASRADLCDCRLVERRCDHRIDLCFKLDLHRRGQVRAGSDHVALSNRMHAGGLARLRVETLGKKIEYCHCCPCCCQVLRVARRLGPGYVLPSDFLPATGPSCLGCGRCVPACPIGIREPGESDPSRCLGCGVCVPACPSEAIRMVGRGPVSTRRRERDLRRNRALAHTLAAFVTAYVLVARWVWERRNSGTLDQGRKENSHAEVLHSRPRGGFPGRRSPDR